MRTWTRRLPACACIFLTVGLTIFVYSFDDRLVHMYDGQVVATSILVWIMYDGKVVDTSIEIFAHVYIMRYNRYVFTVW